MNSEEIRIAPDSRIQVLSSNLEFFQALVLREKPPQPQYIENNITAAIRSRPVEGEPNVYRAQLDLSVSGLLQGLECVRYTVTLVCLVRASELFRDDALVVASGNMLAEARALIGTTSTRTGFGAVILPALDAEKLKALWVEDSPPQES
jgi:hypothetical protein